MHKIQVGILILLVGILVTFIIHRILESPGERFRMVTGYELPRGFEVLGYGTAFNENLLRRGHYWKFSHSFSDFRDFISSTDFHQSDDAVWMMADFEKALGPIGRSTIQSGYELEKDPDDWILLEKGGLSSYYNGN